jgi:uracil-DNA glycosylase family 4
MLRNPACTDCELHRSSKNVCIGGDGPLDADILVIGEAPGEAEARTGKPFQGKSGQLLRDELRKNGLTSVRITNTVRCRPPDNRKPETAEMKACRKYLDAEIEAVKPKAILMVGGIASKAILNKPKITQIAGEISEIDGVVHCAIYHPAYTLYDMSKLPQFQKDLAKFAGYMRGVKPEDTVQYDIVTKENLDRFFEDLERCEEFSFDVETPGLDWFNPEHQYIRSLQIACGFGDGIDFGWVIPLQIEGSPFYNDRLRRMIIDRIFAILKDKPGIAHNGKFDNIYLQIVYGITFFLSFDTMLASHTLNENRAHGLKELVRGHFNEPEYDIDKEAKTGQGILDLKKFYKYGAKDAVYTLRLKRIFMREFKKDRVQRNLFFGLVMPAARAMQDIDANGLYVNLELRDKTEIEVQAGLVAILKKLNGLVAEHCGPDRVVNWNSPQQVAKLMYGDLGLRCTVFTDKKAPSTGEEALLAIKDKHPIADMLVEYRELEKFRSTYIDGWKPFMVGPMVYFSTKIHGTVTGRWSSRLHQVPRDGTIRNLIDAPEGWIFCQADFSQAELRIAAIMAKDVELITCYRRGIDVHWRTLMDVIGSGGAGSYVEPAFKTAAALNGRKRPKNLTVALELMLEAGHERCIEIWKGWKEARKRAKAVNFGYLYGMKELKFIETCKLKYGFEPTHDEASRSRTAFFHRYRQLPDWHDKQKRLCAIQGHVLNLAGRMRRLPGIFSTDRSASSEAERQAINSPVQGYIGDHKAAALVEIHDSFDRDTELRIVGEVHDSILLWIRPNEVNRLLPRVSEIMQRPRFIREMKIDLPVPIEAEFELGPWGKGRTWRL